MNIFVLLSLISSVILFFLGNWVYSLAKKETINKVFLFLCMALSFWAFTEFMGRQADSLDTAYFWLRASALWPLAIGLFVHFALVFSEEKKLLAKKLTYILIYGPAVVFMIIDSTTNLVSTGLIKEVWGYAAVLSENSWVFWISQAWTYAMVLSALILCSKHYFKTTDKDKKQQAKYVSLGFTIPLSAFVFTGLVAPMVFNLKIPDLTITSTAGLGAIIAYAIWKYELFSLNPATAVEKIISIMPNGLILADQEGKILTVNQTLVNLSGYKESELVGNSANMLFDEELFGKQIKEKLLNDGVLKDYETTLKTKKGEKCNVSFSGVFAKNKEGHIVGIVGVANDITERKKSVAILLRSEERFRQLSDNAEEWVWEVDSKGLYTYSSSVVEKLLGFKPEEIVGTKYFYDLFVEDERERLKAAAFGAFANKGSFSGFENRNVKKNSNIVLFSTSGVPILDDKGDLLGYRGLDIDITERKKTEEELSRAMDRLVLVNEKLGVVGSLTRHDVGNKLMTAKSNLYLLKKQIGDNPKLTKYVDNVETALASSDEIFEFSRFYEKIGVEKPSAEHVFECFNQAIALMPNLGKVEIINDCRGLVVEADSLLKQLFYNFLDNSMKHGEKVTQIHLHYTQDVEGVKLFYEDNGIGMTEAYKLKLFTEGFSTGKSTGLGLFLTKKMMDVYGWTIEEKGESCIGAKFIMTIPKLNKNGKENYKIKP
jgi:PAS domain S-box-containing protein